MQMPFWIIAVLAALVMASGAADAKTSKAPSNAAIECFKQYGGHYDTATKKWRFETREGQMGSWEQAVNGCIAQKTGRRGNYVHSYPAYR